MATSDKPNDNQTIPNLSSNDIELKAQELIEFFDATILDEPKQTPILEFAEETKSRFGLIFRCDVDLGVHQADRKILGRFGPKPLSIFIDVSLKNTERFPFVLAHEFGHFVLHRRIDPIKSGYAGSQINDTQHDFVTGKKILITPRDWIEWQANRFASAILMPRLTFINVLVDFQISIGIRRNIGKIFLENQNCSLSDFNECRSHLSRLYSVNKTNVKCRLKDLEILVDLRKKDTKHISELFMEE